MRPSCSAKIRRQWFAKRKSIMAILKEVMTNEASVLMDTDAANKALDADAALQELGTDAVGAGLCHRDRHGLGRGPRVADERLRLVEKTIQGRDFTCMRERRQRDRGLARQPAGPCLRQCPPAAGLDAQPRAHDAVLGGLGRAGTGRAFPGAAAVLRARPKARRRSASRLHVGDVGHTLIVGPTGAGKSVLLALMALQFRRYAGAQVFAFDFGGSIRAAALAMGGDWHDLGGALADDASAPVALQPLARIDDAGERAWAAEWVAALLAREVRHRHPGAEGASMVGADLARLRAGVGADHHRPLGAACSPTR